MNYEIHTEDCLAAMRRMPDCSVDSIVTDPPYGLSFMGKKWDYDVPSTQIWAECLRVLKPGGHLLAFAGTRTQHRMAVRIEDAGFEIRDMIAWVYGSGFPKSLDVSGAIDKQRTEDIQPVRVVCRAIRAAMDAKGLKSRGLVEHFDNCHPRLIDHWAARDTDSQPALPTWDQWQKLHDVLGMDAEHDAEVWRLNGRKGTPGEAWAEREVLGTETRDNSPSGIVSAGRERTLVERKITAPHTEAARQWQGWGTAVKPALEPITVARNPLDGTVASNVLQHGTGALNIDGCRVNSGPVEIHTRTENVTQASSMAGVSTGSTGTGQFNTGRWPANFIHDGSDEVVAGFPQTTSGGRKSSHANNTGKSKNAYNGGWGPESGDFQSDKGSAARFFYCAKASKRDRDDGLDGFREKDRHTLSGGAMVAEGRTAEKGKATARNIHPTVKPTDLMRYLVRLVTPPRWRGAGPVHGQWQHGQGRDAGGLCFCRLRDVGGVRRHCPGTD